MGVRIHRRRELAAQEAAVRELRDGGPNGIRNPDLLDLKEEEKELRSRWVELCSFIYQS
jgi:hypothetical protein